jgi:redox-sensitive bicupin YhaK (pirin superfamily)
MIEAVLEAHARTVGNATVQRVLPSMQRRSIGPFVFLDHMGPETLPLGETFDVGPHPHIGLATVTYLFEGEVVHRDSLGSVQTIVPGDLNWMTAGRGIVHSERGPGPTMHGLQMWVGLPVANEEDEPTFEHVPKDAIATVREGVRLLAGTAYGERAIVKTKSPLFLLEARFAEGQTLPFPSEHPARAAYVVGGEIEIDGRTFGAKTLVAVAPGDAYVIAKRAAHVVLLGGAPFPETRHMLWNFVSSSKERLARAEADWRAMRFPRIPTDDGEPIAMPERGTR